jgi:hypothetical protein
LKEDRDRKFTHRKDAKQESRHRGRLHSSLLLVALPSPLLTVFFQQKKQEKKKHCSSPGWRSNHVKSNLCLAAVMSIAYR